MESLVLFTHNTVVVVVTCAEGNLFALVLQNDQINAGAPHRTHIPDLNCKNSKLVLPKIEPYRLLRSYKVTKVELQNLNL